MSSRVESLPVESRSVEQRIERLSRPDKWYLAAGDGILWAPAFPVWLHAPGFWDEAHVYYHPFAPLFGVALVDERGIDVPLALVSRKWRPDWLECVWRAADGAEYHERREARPRGRFVSRWTAARSGGPGVWGAGRTLVAFTAQPGEQVVRAEGVEGGVRWRRALTDRRNQTMEVDATLTVRGVAGKGVRVAAVRSEGSAVQPVWRFTPFVERWGKDGLREEVRLEGILSTGLVYAAVAARLEDAVGGKGGQSAAEFEIELLPVEPAYRLPEMPSAATDCAKFFGSFPALTCSDPMLEKYYDYRLYGLRLCRLEGGAGNVKHPAIAEGISYFHVPITYSGQCHMLEMRWRSDPAEARGTLLNFLDHQKEDGSFHGRLYTNHLIDTDFYLASWGDAALAVDALHPSEEYLARIYGGLCRYDRWMDTSRDPEGSGMYDVINHFETGQEYMSRYQAVNPQADLDGWKTNTKLKAIDATVYAYQMKRALARMAERLGKGGDSAAHRAGAERVGAAITGKMWDAEAGVFTDVDPREGRMIRTGVRAAVGFYPLLTDLPTDEHLARMLALLQDPREFGTPFPLPSSSVSDPLFNADAEWKGKRHVCPWNGRVWPMTNSHVIDGLIRQWRMRGAMPAERTLCGAMAGVLLAKYVRMMFHDGDLARPNCFEHYNPINGRACEYRGIDDYQHSWVNDLLIRALVGIDPGADGRCGAIVIDPVPMGKIDAEIGPFMLRGGELRVKRAGDAFEGSYAGRPFNGRIGEEVTLQG